MQHNEENNREVPKIIHIHLVQRDGQPNEDENLEIIIFKKLKLKNKC